MKIFKFKILDSHIQYMILISIIWYIIMFYWLLFLSKANIEHPVLEELLLPIREIYNDVRRKALMRLEYEGLNTVEAVVAQGSRFYNDPAAYAMDKYAYYVCYKCKKVNVIPIFMCVTYSLS